MTAHEARAVELVRRYGRTGTAFQVLNPGLAYWFDAGQGMVAYMDTGGAWVAAGEPIAPLEAVEPVARRFVAAAHAAGRRASFFGTEESLARATGFRCLRLGEQPVWDPQQWEAHRRAHRSLREQLRRARAKGVTVRELTAADLQHDSTLHGQVDAVVRHWLATRPMPPMHFLVEVVPLRWLTHRRVYIAERAGVVIAVLSCAPVPARNGWLFEHVLRNPDAPNGTTDALIDAAMRARAREGVTWVTLGFAPLSGEVNRALRWARRLSQPLFNFSGLTAFKRKFRPQHWEPIYLTYPSESGPAVALLDGLRAFAGGALWRFGLRAVLRRPVRALVRGDAARGTAGPRA